MIDRTGQQIGNYLLIRLLGQGGFAEVYLGQHIYLKTQAAIKILLTQISSDDIDGFLNEARIIAHLVHPNIVRVLDFGMEGKTPFLVMDYAPDGTLRQRHPKGTRLDSAIIVPYVKQIAIALQYAHDQKLIHRDVKPENILVGRHTEILLSDFGIALVAQSSRYQSTQDVIGTVAYMSPEQIQGKPRPASDQYSLGIVTYEWLTGDRPFHGSFTELCTQHMFAPPPSMHERVPTISPELEQVVSTALAKDPKARFESVQAFAKALAEAGHSKASGSAIIGSPIQRPSGQISATIPAHPASKPYTSASSSKVKPPANSVGAFQLAPQPNIAVQGRNRSWGCFSVAFVLLLLAGGLWTLGAFFLYLFTPVGVADPVAGAVWHSSEEKATTLPLIALIWVGCFGIALAIILWKRAGKRKNA